MAAILSWMHQPSASLVATAYHSCHSSHKEISVTALCTSSQLCHQGLSSLLTSRPGFPETRSYVQVSHFIRRKQTLRLNATSITTDLAAASGDVVGDDGTEPFQFSDTNLPSDVNSTLVEIPGSESTGTSSLPTQLDDAASLAQGGAEAADSSSPIVPGDLPVMSPSVEIVPSLGNEGNSIPSTSAPALDVFSTAGDNGSAGETILSAKERYLRATQGANQGLEQLKTDDIGDSIKAAQDTAVAVGEGLVNAIKGAIDSAGSSVKNTYNDINGSILRIMKTGTGSYDKNVDDLQSTVDNAQGVAVDVTSVFRMGTPANDALKEIVVVVKTAAGSVLAVAGNVILQAYSSVKENVPEDVQSAFGTGEERISKFVGPVSSAIDQAIVLITDAERAVGIDPENPAIPVVSILGGSLFLGLSYLNSRYGGYSGDLLPAASLDLLKNDRDVVLVDIRPQEARETQGIPDLRRSTRSKFATVEVVKVEGALRSLLKNGNDIEAVLTAAVIRNLKNVNRYSKIIVLDGDGGQSKTIARGLRRTGIRKVYRVDGGFKAWASAGLRCKLEGLQNSLTILQEDAEAIVEEVKPTSVGVVAVLMGLVAGTYAVVEWEKTLQLIGVLGLATTVYSRVEAYESVEDFKADLRLLQKPFNCVTQALVWITMLLEPKTLQLATSPASSNVQGRVIQAAAKHGSTSSELELVQDDSTVISGMEDGVGDESTQSQHTSLQEPQ